VKVELGKKMLLPQRSPGKVKGKKKGVKKKKGVVRTWHKIAQSNGGEPDNTRRFEENIHQIRKSRGGLE